MDGQGFAARTKLNDAMQARVAPPIDVFQSGYSRRSLLADFITVPAATAFTPPAARLLNDPGGATQIALPLLIRDREKRALSRVRYRNAEEFFCGLDREMPLPDRLYRAGIAYHLGLTSHLLDVGFDDQWCAKHIGLNVGAALRFSNATGLGVTEALAADLAVILSPYSRWRHTVANETVVEGSIIAAMPAVIRRALDHIADTTGHSRPRPTRSR